MRVLPLLTVVLALGAVSVPGASVAAASTIADSDGLLTGPHAGKPEAVAWRWLTDHKEQFGLDSNDLGALELTDRSRVSNGVTHLEWTQIVRGVEGLNATIRINVASDGRILNAGGDPIADLTLKTARPKLSAGTALRIAQRNARVPAGRPGPHDDADLLAVAHPGADRLAWRVIVAGRGPLVYSTLIDATTGAILKRTLLTRFADASVFENHPGAAHGGTQTTVPLGGWLTAADKLLGPNAYTFADLNDEPAFGESDYDVADAGEDVAPSTPPDYLDPQVSVPAGVTQHCPTAFSTPCSWSGLLNDGTRATNRGQRATQLFYFVNVFHDWLATEVGFTSADGNFEGSDPLIAQTDDGGAEDCDHLGNANMLTPPDGTSPIMQMYFFGSRSCPGPDHTDAAVSSADDASVVFHEYTHGLTNRLIGDGFGLSANQSGAMGEGWSDWYAMDYLADPGNGPLEPDTGADGEIAVGKYVTDNTVRGIRRAAMDCPVNSVATGCQPIASMAGPGGYTYADLGRVSSSDPAAVHANGEIWAQTLWDLRAALGPAVARDRVTDGMRLSPTIDPSFVDMRNAIISADVVAGGTNVNAIWAVFAARGMGCSAKSPSADSTTTVTAAFDLPVAGNTCPVTATATPVVPPAIASPTTSVRLDRKGRFKFRFSATPAGAAGSITFKTTNKIKSGATRKILTLATRSFTVSATGKVELQLKLSKSTFKKVKTKRKLPAKVTLKLGGKTFTMSLTLKR